MCIHTAGSGKRWSRRGRTRGAGLVILLLLLAACGISPFDTPQSRITIQADGHFSGQQMTPAEAERLVAKQARNISPVLFPSYLTDGLKTCIANGTRDTFNLQCFAGTVDIELATQTENPKEYKPLLIRRLKFRNDPKATFMDDNPAKLDVVRMVLWIEPGHSPDNTCKCVHYDLHSQGSSAIEFWKIANSLLAAKSS